MLKRCTLFVLLGAIACGPTPKAEKRLESFGTVEMPAVVRFVAAKYFREGNNNPDAPAFDYKRPMILQVVDEFEKHLLGKVETNVPATTMSIHRVAMIGKGDLLIKELGDRAETNLAYVWELLARQPSPSDREGVLYSERQSLPFIQNVFFIRGTDGNLWAVSVYWAELHSSEEDNYGWVINAVPTSNPWDNDVRVFSR
ncbi:MAG: hypothetical protein NT006_04710 [Candidatus Aminicenantes bacterium]|nr:hypothetical protein [Candidatus Aminicenantes bacterium]